MPPQRASAYARSAAVGAGSSVAAIVHGNSYRTCHVEPFESRTVVPDGQSADSASVAARSGQAAVRGHCSTVTGRSPAASAISPAHAAWSASADSATR